MFGSIQQWMLLLGTRSGGTSVWHASIFCPGPPAMLAWLMGSISLVRVMLTDSCFSFANIFFGRTRQSACVGILFDNSGVGLEERQHTKEVIKALLITQ